MARKFSAEQLTWQKGQLCNSLHIRGKNLPKCGAVNKTGMRTGMAPAGSPAENDAILSKTDLDEFGPEGYIKRTRERRLIQLMTRDCSSCFVREVTEA